MLTYLYLPFHDPVVMSVGRGGGSRGIAGYNDVNRQDRYFHYSVSAAELDGTADQAGGQYFKIEDAESVGLHGNLRPTEEAELLRFEAELVAYINSTETADGSMEARATISLKGNNPMYENNDAGVFVADVNGTEWDRIDAGGSIDNRILTTHTMAATGPFSDGGSGVGGGGSGMRSYREVSFHDEFGAGPIMDSSSDDIYLHLEGRQWNIADAAIHIAGTWTCFFDTYPIGNE